MSLKYVALDIETNGLSDKDHSIIEIALVGFRPSGRVDFTWHSLIKPKDGGVGEWHEHGITEADLVHAPTFEQVAGRIMQLIAGRIIVAHNAEFDAGFLVAAFQRMGFDPQLPFVCSYQTARQGMNPARLQDVADHFGLTNGGKHQALHDAELVAKLWPKLPLVRSSVKELKGFRHEKPPNIPVDVRDGHTRAKARSV